jgi:4-hydroxybenzoate polyprenyltransferase
MSLARRSSGPDQVAVTRLQTYLSFVRFSHTVFALPFALTGALLALHRAPLATGEAARRVGL